nr:universal stress protein [Streptomyces sp. NBC_00974]
MANRVTVGLDGSAESTAAARWAAHEAELRGASLDLVHAEERLENPNPSLRVDSRATIGQSAIQILDAASTAALVVVGRRIRHSASGAHIGPVTHAVMHHAVSPVAVIAHE